MTVRISMYPTTIYLKYLPQVFHEDKTLHRHMKNGNGNRKRNKRAEIW